MRFLKFIFGRFSIITLLVILQVVGFVGLIMHLDIITPYYYFISLSFSVVGILIVLILINRQINPNYIVPWIVIILLVPILGVAVYFMFSKNRLRYQQKRRYRRIHKASCEYVKQCDAAINALEKSDKGMMRQSQYLYSASKLPLYTNTFTEYYPSGESFFESLKVQLQKAKKFIFLEFFIIEEGKMFNAVLDILTQKVAEGIEVRLMYDDIGSIATVSSFYYLKLRKKGIKCVKFNRFLPIASAMHNNRDHRKIVVIDGVVGFMCGCNLADEYINVRSKCGHWKDSGIMLSGDGVKSMTIMFLQMYNAQSKTCEDFSPYLAGLSGSKAKEDNNLFKAKDNLLKLQNNPLNYKDSFLKCENNSFKCEDKYINSEDESVECKNDFANKSFKCENLLNFKDDLQKIDLKLGFVQPFGDGPVPLYIEKVCQNAILNIINQAVNYVYITTPYLIVDFQLTEAIKSAAKRGVDVRIVTPHIPDKKIVFMMTRAAYRSLIASGVKIYEYTPGFMHSKNFLADDKVAIVGSMNMDYRSLVHHFECGVWLYGTPCIAEIKKDICDIIQVSHLVSYKESRLNPFQKMIRLVLELFAPLL